MTSAISEIVLWPTAVVLAVATVTDLKSRRIPNWLTIPYMAAGLAVAGWEGGWLGELRGLGGFALGVCLYGLLNLMGGMGMGDVKLCAAIGIWIGPPQLMLSMVLTAMVGGVMAFAWAVGGGFVGDLFKGSGDLIFGFSKRGLSPHPELALSNPLTRKMPYAPAIAIGTLLSFFGHN